MNERVEALKATTPEWLRPYTSPEWYIDEAVKQLISKGWHNLTPAEQKEYAELVQERVDRMMPAAIRRIRERTPLQPRSRHSWWRRLFSH